MKNILIIILLIITGIVHGQTPRKPLPRSINIPAKNHISPSLSGDGRHMVFSSNYSSSGKMVLKYTYVDDNGLWAEPAEITTINRPGMDFIGGHFLSYDGRYLFLTSKRGPGIGSYDILFSERQGSYWTPPQNIGKPINSPGNDGHASLSPDGRYLYFMRCREMDIYSCNDCELFMAEKKTASFWHDPVKLPFPVNQGNEATPVIMPDGETLIFASERPGSKGGYDLYQTQQTSEGWTEPVALDYLNTSIDDQFVSMPAHANAIYYSTLFRGNHTIIMAQIPESLKPKKVVMINGNIKDAITGNPLEGVAQVYNAITGELDQFIKTDDAGDFFVMIKGDNIYDFSVITKDNNYLYFSKLYNLHRLQNSKIEEFNLELKPVRPGSSFVCEGINFKPYSSEISNKSSIAVKRLFKFLKDNKGSSIEIGVYQDRVNYDSIPANPDLTEVITDTIYQQMPYIDSALYATDSLEVKMLYDSLMAFYCSEGYRKDTIDNRLFKLEFTYHNDRTQKQADKLAEELTAMGVPSYLLKAKGYGDAKKEDSIIDLSDDKYTRRWVKISIQ